MSELVELANMALAFGMGFAAAVFLETFSPAFRHFLHVRTRRR